MSVLIKNDDGWELKDEKDTVVLSGGYPLVEDREFIERAAKKLDTNPTMWEPYDVVDNRH